MNKIFLGIVGVLVVAGLAFFLLSNQSKKTGVVSTPNPSTAASVSPSAQQSQNTVTLTVSGFSPSTIRVKKGDTVTFVNKSGAMAAVNSDPHPIHILYPFLNLGRFADGETMQVTLTQTRTFTYHNHLNPSQTGTIIAE